MDAKLEKLIDAMSWDAGVVTPDTPLSDLAWDSVSVLTVIALSRTAGKTIAVEDIGKMKTVRDVLSAF